MIEALREHLIDEVLRLCPEAVEGAVETVGAPDYRRLDVGGRALAYLRLHRKSAPGVRVDLTGWFGPVQSERLRPSAGGVGTLWVRGEADLGPAAELLARLAAGRSASGAAEAPKHEEHEHAGDGDVQPEGEREA